MAQSVSVRRPPIASSALRPSAPGALVRGPFLGKALGLALQADQAGQPPGRAALAVPPTDARHDLVRAGTVLERRSNGVLDCVRQRPAPRPLPVAQHAAILARTTRPLHRTMVRGGAGLRQATVILAL